MTSPHVVLGAGPLGRATAQALLARGKSVRIVNRSGVMRAPPEGAALAAGDLTKPAPSQEAFRDAAAFYFCAQPEYHEWPKFFRALQRGAIDAASGAGAPLIVAENLYAYGPTKGPMTESLSARPNTIKGSVRAQMHDELMEAQASGRIQVAVGRGSDFFGPWVEGSTVGSRAFEAIATGKPAEVFGDPDSPHSFTFVEDFGAALARLGTEERALGQIWHVPNAPAVSTRRFMELAYKMAEKPMRLRRVSLLELRVAGLFIPGARETIEMLHEFEEPFVVDHQRFASMFGDISTPLETAIAKTVAWTQSHASGKRP